MTSRSYNRMISTAALTEGEAPCADTLRAICAEVGAEFVSVRRARTATGNKIKGEHDLFIRRAGDVDAIKRAIRSAAQGRGITLRTIEAH